MLMLVLVHAALRIKLLLLSHTLTHAGQAERREKEVAMYSRRQTVIPANTKHRERKNGSTERILGWLASTSRNIPRAGYSSQPQLHKLTTATEFMLYVPMYHVEEWKYLNITR